MPFVKGDSKINRSGRPTDAERTGKMTKRQLRERELLMLLRKIRPHVADSIFKAATIMQNDAAGAQNQLKAATILLDNYRRLVLDLYDDGADPGEEGTEVQQQNAPVFSLKVIKDTEG